MGCCSLITLSVLFIPLRCPTFVDYILGRDDRNDGRGLMGPPGPPGKPGQMGPKGKLILVEEAQWPHG